MFEKVPQKREDEKEAPYPKTTESPVNLSKSVDFDDVNTNNFDRTEVVSSDRFKDEQRESS